MLLISAWLLPAWLPAQNANLAKDKMAVQDTAMAKQWVLKAEYYRFYKPDSALYFINQVLQLPPAAALNKYYAAAYNSMGYATYMKAQYNNAIDAFRNYYNYSRRDNSVINMAYALNNEGNVYIELGDYSTALKKYKEALKLRQDIRDQHGIAMSYNNIGFIYKDIGDYEKAIDNFYAALRVFEKEKDELAVATTYNYLGAVYFRQKNFREAISIQKNALQMQEARNDLNGQGISLQSIANAHSELNEYEPALAYYSRAIKIYERSGDLRQLGLLYASMGQLYNKQKKYAAALEALEKSLDIHSKINNKRSLASTQLNTAVTLINLEKPVAAKQLIDSAAKTILLTGNKTDKKNLYEAETLYYESINELKNALLAYRNYNNEKDSLLNSENIKAMTDVKIKYETEKKDLEINILSKQDSIKSLQLKVQESAISQQLLTITQQQLALTESDLEIEAKEKRILQGQIDSSKKAQEIEMLNRQAKIQNLELLNQKLQVRNRNYILLVVSILSLSVLLIGYSYYRRYRLKKEKELQAAIFQQQDLATKAVMEAEETERQRIAKDLHDGVGQMMSAAKMNLSAIETELGFTDPQQRLKFEKIIGLVDESCKEVRAVSHNMMPNALLKNGLANAIKEFIDKIDSNVIKVSLHSEGLKERLEANTEIVLYRVIQECVNNVIKHSGATQLDISLIKDSDGISATIEDNGRGFDTSDKSKFGGMGLKNIQTRVEYLKGSVEFDSTPGHGTVVSIHI